MEYKCNICKTQYSSYKSRWLHVYKYHKQEVSKSLPKLVNPVSQKLAFLANSESNILKCKYCINIYKHKSSKSKHEKICKSRIDSNLEINEIKKENEIELIKKENEIELIKKEMLELKKMLQKALKIHP